MNHITGKWALVTGTSSGLGIDFAHELAKRGMNIVLVARREERLREVSNDLIKHYGVETAIISMDLATDPAPQMLFDLISRRDIEIEVLVNNAGYGLYGNFLEIDRESELNMLKLDIITLTHLTKLYSRKMVERGSGYILQVASIGAYQPSPTYASYSAAKSYVLYFGEALNYELRNTGVSCTVIAPGITNTEFLDISGQKPSLYQRLMMMDSKDVASIGIKAMLKGKMSVVPGFMNKLTILSTKLLPSRAKAAIAYASMTTG
jgi:short-subunit dehydrogenase